MNNAIYFENDISNEQYQMAVRVLEAMNIAVKKTESKKLSKQDDTRMTEQEFYDMIEESLVSGLVPMSKEELKSLHRV